MVGIGIVGIGFMGMIHYLASRGLKGARVTAICTRDPKRLAGDWTGIQGNFGPPGTVMDLSGVNRHRELDALLADPAVDLVDLCVPSDAHAKLAVKALEAGKHVLVEKPIALTVAEADRMIAAGEHAGRRLMVGHVLPFFPEFAFARDAVQSGRYGPLRSAHFKRVIARPEWSTAIADTSKTGGPALDLHIHDTHFIALACGVPRAVQSQGVSEKGAVAYLATQYLYDDPNRAITCNSGATSASARPFTHGFELGFDAVTIAYEFASVAGEGRLMMPLTLMKNDGSIETPTLGSGDPIDAFTLELEEAAAAVNGHESERLSGALARLALVTCLAEIESAQRGCAIPIPASA